MKKFDLLGKCLSKAEQKMIMGGNDEEQLPREGCLGIMTCSSETKLCEAGCECKQNGSNGWMCI